jgi:hypothetical protein
MNEHRTVHGLGQAISRYAQDTGDPARAEDLEELAGAVLVGQHSKALAEAIA